MVRHHKTTDIMMCFKIQELSVNTSKLQIFSKPRVNSIKKKYFLDFLNEISPKPNHRDSLHLFDYFNTFPTIHTQWRGCTTGKMDKGKCKTHGTESVESLHLSEGSFVRFQKKTNSWHEDYSCYAHGLFKQASFHTKLWSSEICHLL